MVYAFGDALSGICVSEASATVVAGSPAATSMLACDSVGGGTSLPSTVMSRLITAVLTISPRPSSAVGEAGPWRALRSLSVAVKVIDAGPAYPLAAVKRKVCASI